MMMSKEMSLMGLHKDRHGILQQPLERAEQLCAQRSIDYAVVTGDSHADRGCEGYVAGVCFDWLAARGSDGKDRRVWRIYNGGEFSHPVHAKVRYGRGAALIVGRLELFASSSARRL